MSQVSDENLTVEQAFKLADDVLRQGVQSIAELVTIPGDINLDFEDIRTVMSNAGAAWMAIGKGTGENKAVDAAKAAIKSDLLDVSIEGAKGVVINITGGSDLTLKEVNEAADIVISAAHPDAQVFFGNATDLKMEDEVRITIIATGFASDEPVPATPGQVTQITMDEFMEDITKEAELDIPPFLRRAVSNGNGRTGIY